MKKRALLSVMSILLSVTVWAGINLELEQETGFLIGQVTDAGTGEPIADAELVIAGTEFMTTTDDSGNYAFAYVPAGKQIVTASAVRYKSKTDSTIVPPDWTAPLDFALEKKEYVAVALEAYTFGPDAKLEWDLTRPDQRIFYHDGVAANGWFTRMNKAYGVVFDLTDYPDAVLEQIDFCHYAWDVLHGPYQYRIHIFDWDDSSKVATIDGVTVQDTYDAAAWEIAVELGSLPWMPKVGIFIEPLSGVEDDAYPSLSTDSSIPAVQGTSFIIDDINDPFMTVQDAYDRNKGMGDFLMDLWIENAGSGIRIANVQGIPASTAPAHDAERGGMTEPLAVSKPVMPEITALQGFNIYRMKEADDASPGLIATVPPDQMMYEDEDAPPDSNYVYGVSAVFEDGETIIITVPYYHPLFMTIAEAKVDENSDFIPDLLSSVVTIGGVVNTPNYSTDRSDYYLQTADAGINLFALDYIFDLAVGDEVYVTGEIDQDRGLTEIKPESMRGVHVLSKGNAIPVHQWTPAEGFNEVLEAMLVKVIAFRLLNPGQWPGAGSDKSVEIYNLTDTLSVFIDSDTDIDGSPAPLGWFTLTGVLDQNTTKTPPDDGFAIRARSRADFQVMTDVAEVDTRLPRAYALHQNYPNPFNPLTSIRLEMPEAGKVKIVVFDLLGKQVAEIFSGKLAAGYHRFEFDASRLSSGMYLYRVESDHFSDMKKMILVK